MQRVVGAVVVMGMICLGTLLGQWMIRVRPASPDALIVTIPDSLPTPTFSKAKTRASTAPASFDKDPLAFLSHAPADSLDLLPGIGPVLAARIIETRASRGAFTSWDDVIAVKGIGPRLVARWQSLSTRQ